MSEALPHEVCPCCGQRWAMGRSKVDARRLVYSLVKNGHSQEDRLLEVLVDHFGEWLSRDRLVEVIFSNRSDGGPLWAESSIATRLCRLRKRIAPYGLEIQGRSWHGSRLRWAPLPTAGEQPCGGSGLNPASSGLSR
jgi:hypothetical protein